MSRSIVVVLLALSAGVVLAGTAGPGPTAEPAAAELSPMELMAVLDGDRVDRLLQHVQSLSTDERAVLADAVGTLIVTCPYARASMQIPLALREAASEVDPADLAPGDRARWQALLQDLDTHVAVLEAIGMDLRLPKAGDHLAQASMYLVDWQTLVASEDPVADTRRLVAWNDALVQAMGPEQQDLVRENTDVAYGFMGPTSMYRYTGRTVSELRGVAAGVVEPGGRAQLEAMIALVDSHESQGC